MSDTIQNILGVMMILFMASAIAILVGMAIHTFLQIIDDWRSRHG